MIVVAACLPWPWIHRDHAVGVPGGPEPGTWPGPPGGQREQ
jgi:hypothetical protein